MTPTRDNDPFDTDGPSGISGGRGGASRFFARVFENPENPLGWSLRVFTASGIAVRIHLFTILFVAVELLWSIPRKNAGIGFMAVAMGALLLLVLLHEFGHCFACRAVGGAADRIVMLPIGGLALCRPPDRWRAHFATTAGGPLVNAAILPFTSAALWLAGMSSIILFNPFAPLNVIPTIQTAAQGSTAAFWLAAALWYSHYINIILLAFNLLIPAYPMDGGRLLQALLWSRMGYARATEITISIGFAAAGAMGVIGIVANEAILVVIAAFALWSCWAERRRLRGEGELAAANFALGASLAPADDLEDPWTLRKRARERRTLLHEQRELDRILEKIAASGMDSLTRAEKKALKRATDRKRKEDTTNDI